MPRRACYGTRMACKPVTVSVLGTALVVMLSACASTSDRYPSLAIRDAERAHGTAQQAEPTPPPAPVQPSAELSQRLGQLRAQAGRGHQAFLAAAPRTRAAVNAARGSAVASDAWVAAQVSLSSLEITRNDTMTAMADLDKLRLETEVSGGAVEAVSATQAQVNTILNEENALLRQLSASLRQ